MLLNHDVATQPQVCTLFKNCYVPLCRVFNLDYILFYRNGEGRGYREEEILDMWVRHYYLLQYLY